MNLTSDLENLVESEMGLSEEGFLEGDLNARSKTSLRMHYEAQVSVIQKQSGTLDEIRLQLGLSQRKMAQLLLVDPSTWTRWTKQGDQAPPHIWRALQWYLALRDKIPGLTPQYFISTSPQVFHQKALKELEVERQNRQDDIEKLAQKLNLLAQERESLHNQLHELKKDLNFYKKVSIVVLLLSCFGALGLWFWKGL